MLRILALSVTWQTCLSSASRRSRRRLAATGLALLVTWGWADDRENVAGSILLVTAFYQEDDTAMEGYLPVINRTISGTRNRANRTIDRDLSCTPCCTYS
jgi:hypothetical protein